MFLFDKQKTSRQKYSTGSQVDGIRWKTHLKTLPPYCAESTAVVDESGNLYFGSHSSNFYSLSKEGTVRWTFCTKYKIYSSPLIINDMVMFGGGDGNFYALSKDEGDILWIKNLKEGFDTNVTLKMYQSLIHLPFTLSIKTKRIMDTKCWASPNICSNNIVVITGFGKGIYAFDSAGTEKWSYDLGYPRYQIAGVTIDENNEIYCVARSGFIYRFSVDGTIIWKKAAMKGWSSWGNPSCNTLKKQIYFVFSKGDSHGLLYTVNYSGEKNWSSKLNGAIRGSVAISNDSESLYCCDFKGFLYKINSKHGTIEKTIKISQAARALWTTPTIDSDGFIYLSSKDSYSTGRILKLDHNLNVVWEFKTNKTLSVPLILPNGDICFGAWDGYYYCIKTKN